MATKRVHSHACYYEKFGLRLLRNTVARKPEVAMRIDRFTLGAKVGVKKKMPGPGRGEPSVTSEVFSDKTSTFVSFGLPLDFLKVLSDNSSLACWFRRWKGLS